MWAALETHVRGDMNDSTGAQWRETEEGEHNSRSRGATGRRALMQVKMKTGTLCGFGLEPQWGKDESQSLAKWWKFCCRQNGSLNPVGAQDLLVKGNPVHKGWWHYDRHTCPLAMPPLVYPGERVKERSGGEGGDACRLFSFSSWVLIKEAVHLPLKFHPLATPPRFDVGSGNIR